MASRSRAYSPTTALYDDGTPAVDFIGRYEQLEQDINTALTTIGVANASNIPHTNITRNGSKIIEILFR